MTESYFPAISTFETRAAEEHAIGSPWLGAELPEADDTVRLRIAPAGVSVRGRFWREGRYFKAVVHVQTVGAAPKTISVDVDLRPIARALHHWYRRKHGVEIGGWPGGFFNKVAEIAKSKLVSDVAQAVKTVVRSKITGAAISATAVVFPPVGVPAAAAYATANSALMQLTSSAQCPIGADWMLDSAQAPTVDAPPEQSTGQKAGELLGDAAKSASAGVFSLLWLPVAALGIVALLVLRAKEES